MNRWSEMNQRRCYITLLTIIKHNWLTLVRLIIFRLFGDWKKANDDLLSSSPYEEISVTTNQNTKQIWKKKVVFKVCSR